jgi:hypothetical protein
MWDAIGFVPGHGTNSSGLVYSFTDALAPIGRVAYRLRQIDRTGAFAYSGEVEIENTLVPLDPLLLHAFPNPFNPSTTVEFTSRVDGPATVRVFDLLGRHVATMFDGELTRGTTQRRVFDASGSSSGLYVIRFHSAGSTVTTRIALAR